MMGSSMVERLIGLRIKMDRPTDRARPCCRNICCVAPGKGPRAAELACIDCGQHRGCLSKDLVHWLESVIERFGAQTTPVVVRTQTYEKEAQIETN
jgi:hypothetical protein